VSTHIIDDIRAARLPGDHYGETEAIKIETSPCQACGKPTFDTASVPEGTNLNPHGLTMGNARQCVTMGGVKYRLCANCRYDEPFNAF